MRDAWRLAVGTLTVVPVRSPAAVDRTAARGSALLAPLAVLPLGVGVTLVGAAGTTLGSPPLVVGLLAVAVLALGTRALHLDGLSDTADGLTASYDRERSLAVMKGGTAGPAGASALVLVLALQAAGFAALVTDLRSAVLAGAAVCASRSALVLTCARGVPGARADGIGAVYVQTVSWPLAALVQLTVAGVLTGLALWADRPWWQGPVAAALAVLVVLALVARTTRRFGGVTGDVYGAAIELSLAALLLGLVAAG